MRDDGAANHGESAMKGFNWATTRWRLPRTLRQERYAETFAKEALARIFDLKFLDALEKRRESFESGGWKLVGIQVPLFALLALAALNLTFPVTILGITPQSSRSVREILLLVLATIGLAHASLNMEKASLNEIMLSLVRKFAKDDKTAEFVLRKRYGLGTFLFSWETDGLKSGLMQFIVAGLAGAGILFIVAVVVVASLGLQVYVLYDIYRSPSFVPWFAYVTIVFVIACDVTALLARLLTHSVQPFRSYEDLLKLGKMREERPEEYARIVREIVEQHRNRGPLMRLLTRPRMKRLSKE